MSHKLFQVLAELERRKVYFVLTRQRPDSVMISCTLVSLRLEIDVFEDGHIEYSHFKGNESVESGELGLWGLITQFS